MVRITFINGHGEGFASRERVENGATVGDLFKAKFPRDNPRDFSIQVNGIHVAATHELARNDRVSMIRREDANGRRGAEEATVEITFINNAGAGFADKLHIEDDLTVEEFLEDQDINADRSVILVNGVTPAAQDILQQGDRISVTPNKIDAAAVRVTLVRNDGTGYAGRKVVPDGTTAEDFFLDEDADERRHTLRINGQNVERDYVLRDGDRISITPLKIQGALR